MAALVSMKDCKSQQRRIAKKRLLELSLARKKQAAALLQAHLQLLLPSKGIVLSFDPLFDEIDLSPVNAWLKKRGRLALPHVAQTPQIHQIFPPRLIPPSMVCCALIPALGFNKEGFRLGRGKGFYDRLLPFLEKAWGVGFEEQMMEDMVLQAHDKPVSGMLLF